MRLSVEYILNYLNVSSGNEKMTDEKIRTTFYVYKHLKEKYQALYNDSMSERINNFLADLCNDTGAVEKVKWQRKQAQLQKQLDFLREETEDVHRQLDMCKAMLGVHDNKETQARQQAEQRWQVVERQAQKHNLTIDRDAWMDDMVSRIMAGTQ